MADVAERAGVSRSLVSTVFRGVPGASPSTRARVLEAASDLGYRLDNRARMLRRSRTRLLGVMFRVGDPFHSDLVEALYPAAASADYDLVLSATTSERSESEAVSSLLHDRCEAILLIAPQVPDGELRDIAGKAPTIAIARRAGRSNLDVVRTRDDDVVKTALEHLEQLGHRRIVHVDGGDIQGSVDRRRSFRRLMRRHRLDADARVVPGGNTEVAGQQSAQRLLAGGDLPTAAIAFNDACAVGLMFGLRSAGVKVPEDVSVIGYDDVRMAALPFIGLTTVGQDATATAQAAIARAVARLDQGDPAGTESVVAPYLVERTTTAPPPAP